MQGCGFCINYTLSLHYYTLPYTTLQTSAKGLEYPHNTALPSFIHTSFIARSGALTLHLLCDLTRLTRAALQQPISRAVIGNHMDARTMCCLPVNIAISPLACSSDDPFILVTHLERSASSPKRHSISTTPPVFYVQLVASDAPLRALPSLLTPLPHLASRCECLIASHLRKPS